MRLRRGRWRQLCQLLATVAAFKQGELSTPYVRTVLRSKRKRYIILSGVVFYIKSDDDAVACLMGAKNNGIRWIQKIHGAKLQSGTALLCFISRGSTDVCAHHHHEHRQARLAT